MEVLLLLLSGVRCLRTSLRRRLQVAVRINANVRQLLVSRTPADYGLLLLFVGDRRTVRLPSFCGLAAFRFSRCSDARLCRIHSHGGSRWRGALALPQRRELAWNSVLPGQSRRPATGQRNTAGARLRSQTGGTSRFLNLGTGSQKAPAAETSHVRPLFLITAKAMRARRQRDSPPLLHRATARR